MALRHIGTSYLIGPINCAAPGNMQLRTLIEIIESKLKKSAYLVEDKSTDKIHSPYGWENDKYMDTTRIYDSGFLCENTHNWLPELVSRLTV